MITLKAATQRERKGPPIVDGEYYVGRIQSVGFFKNKEGKIVGSRPFVAPDGTVKNPKGAMRIKVLTDLDKFPPPQEPLMATFPWPWDYDRAPAWIGDPQTGEASQFTEEDMAKYTRPLQTGSMKHAIVIVAENFGWKPFEIDVNNQPQPNDLNPEALLVGQRVLQARIVNAKGQKSWDIRPLPSKKKTPIEYANELFKALGGSALGDGKPFTWENAAMSFAVRIQTINTGKPLADQDAETLEKVIVMLIQSCQHRQIAIPAREIVEMPQGDAL